MRSSAVLSVLPTTMSWRSGEGNSRPNLIERQPVVKRKARTTTAQVHRMAPIITRDLGRGQSATASARDTITAVETFAAEERRRLAPYFTNLDGPVFALVNLPEVVKGALFARYSRSPKSVRRLFIDEFLDQVEQ